MTSWRNTYIYLNGVENSMCLYLFGRLFSFSLKNGVDPSHEVNNLFIYDRKHSSVIQIYIIGL